MIFLKVYLIGIAVCFLISLLLEHFYFGNGRSETVHFRTMAENFLYSLLSWLGVVGEIIFWAAEWYTGFTQKGGGAYLHDYEEQLKQSSQNSIDQSHEL